jgi:hypothetical protein
MEGGLLPSRVIALFSGSTRELPEEGCEPIDAWARRFAGSVEHYTRRYLTQALFLEDGSDYWLAIPDDRIPSEAGAPFELFAIRLGGFREGSGWEYQILIESMRSTLGEAVGE